MKTEAHIKSTDIVYEGWVGKMPAFIRPYLILMRADRPIGTWLLLLPCWWSLALASTDGINLWYLCLFGIGAFIMRGAGCVMNDLADRNYDKRVARTALRPIPNGDVSVVQAMIFMGFLCLIGLWVLLQFNPFSWYLGAASLLLVFIYPFCKRWTYWPQVVLGLTFNWGALLGWSVIHEDVAIASLCVYFAGLFWTLGYDTVYAHQDKEDDVMVGIKSTALKLGSKTKPAMIVFYGLTAILLIIAGYLSGADFLFYMAALPAMAHLIWQIRTVDIDDPKNCLMIFKSNKVFGLLFFLACLTTAY